MVNKTETAERAKTDKLLKDSTVISNCVSAAYLLLNLYRVHKRREWENNYFYCPLPIMEITLYFVNCNTGYDNI